MDEYIAEEEGGGFSAASFMMGVAVGIVGAVIFAAYAEDRFFTLSRATKRLGDQAGTAATQVGGKVSDAAGKVAEVAKQTYSKVAKKAKDEAEDAQDTAKQFMS